MTIRHGYNLRLSAFDPQPAAYDPRLTRLTHKRVERQVRGGLVVRLRHPSLQLRTTLQPLLRPARATTAATLIISAPPSSRPAVQAQGLRWRQGGANHDAREHASFSIRPRSVSRRLSSLCSQRAPRTPPPPMCHPIRPM